VSAIVQAAAAKLEPAPCRTLPGGIDTRGAPPKRYPRVVKVAETAVGGMGVGYYNPGKALRTTSHRLPEEPAPPPEPDAWMKNEFPSEEEVSKAQTLRKTAMRPSFGETLRFRGHPEEGRGRGRFGSTGSPRSRASLKYRPQGSSAVGLDSLGHSP